MLNEITLSQLLEQARSFVAEKKFLHAAQVYKRITEVSPSLEA